ncbi:N-acyl-D-amino-acid deacylase family protein [Mucilaginibacter ginsenosidivorans]|uniref:D-aminoacylase n=1 Tax=Mucilaginibacter ginsenosidivorans TaxID=398053 RepID=A0A5B8UVL9_9SPHI|nr:D-aminoacylase [Mucilaginibacter ginsenosidivorans]QEC62993.1 D-aminoacylase [Mucilaginibacter ginsenosidivorans]
MLKLKLLLFSCLLPSLLFAQKHFDIILKHGKIIDGAGNPWFYGDVGIIKDKIVSIGDLSKRKAKKTIDAAGLIIAPGFIDVHTHIEGDEKKTPTADNFIYDGVTTVITGNCGSSNIDIAKYFKQLDSIRLSINVATLIGHNDVRRAVLGEKAITPDSAQLQQMENLVEQAMRDGAVGFSTGLIYTPGLYSKTPEVIALAKAAAKYHGVYTSHMRNESDKIFDAINEAIDVGREAGMPVEISHFKVGLPNWNKSDQMIAMVEKARAEGLDVTVDQYPYTASSTTLNVLLPDWLLDGGRDSVMKRLADPVIHQKVVDEMIKDMTRRGRQHFDYAVVAHCDSDTTLNGKNIMQINIIKGGAPTIPNEIETILDITKTGSASMVFHGMNEDDVENILKFPLTMVASDSGIRLFGSGVPHPRGYGSNARVLGYYVREKHLIRLEDAVRKMTSLPAQKFHLTGRGLLQPGMFADIVIFDAGTVKDESTFEHPHAYSVGFKYVLVNGQLTVDNFKHTGTRNGAILRGPGFEQKK